MSWQQELERFDPHAKVSAANTPPGSWYTSAEFYQRERSRVLLDSWQAVGRLDQVAAPGDYFTGTFAGEPYVVVRDNSGELRAFYNVCRHHAALVAQAVGRCEQLVCPYHGWTYELDGRLRKAPGLGKATGFDVADYGLQPIALATWGPWVLLHFGNQPAELISQIESLDARLAATGFDQLVFVARRSYELTCNWKVFVDNYLDGGYHVEVLHRDLAGQLDTAGYQIEVAERYSIQSCAANTGASQDTGGASVDFAERIGSQALYAWVYPNFMINRYGPIMDTNWVVPLGVDRTLTVFDYFFEPRLAGDRDFVERSLAASHQVQLEDVGICESVQQGLASRSYDRGRYAAVERPMHAFHCLLWEAMSRD